MLDPGGRGQHRVPRGIAVAMHVVAAENRDWPSGSIAPERQPGREAFERRALSRCWRLGVARFGHGHRQDLRRRRGDQLRRSVVVARRSVYVIDDRADHSGRALAAVLLDQGVEVILAGEGRRHRRVLLEKTQADDPDIASACRELIGVKGKVSPVEPTDADVDNGRSEAAAIVGRDRYPGPGELAELVLPEADWRGPGHVLALL